MKQNELNEILEQHKLWLSDNSTGKKADLSEADLSKADLTGADLTGADLTGADLSEADLSKAYLTGANLSRTSIIGFYLGKHFGFYHEGYVKIGCIGYSLDYWLENYEAIGKNSGYDKDTIERYGDQLHLLEYWRNK